MNKDVIISNLKDFERKKKEIISQGVEHFQVVTDFDRTLTKNVVNGKESPTTWGLIRFEGSLGSDYFKEAQKDFDYYRPIELDQTISLEEKTKKMIEWWERHFALLFKHGFSKQLIDKIISEDRIVLREGVLEFIDFLHEKNIPLIILSAGIGDLIKSRLEKDGRLYENVHIVSNFAKFDESGKAIGIFSQIITAVNKHETEIHKLPIYEDLLKRKNVLLLGDSLDDLWMISGFPYSNLLNVCFFGDGLEFKENKFEGNVKSFMENYDVVLLNDPDFSWINEFVKEL